MRNSKALAEIVKEADCDAVVVQELVAPPDLRLVPGSDYFSQLEPASFPDGEPHVPSSASTEFFVAMVEAGFDKFYLSEEDTGPGRRSRINSASTEWYVTFYKSSKLKLAEDLPSGFISSDGRLADHRIYDRVPYALAFRTLDDSYDFVLISVHLRPGSGPYNRNRRRVELRGVSRWIKHRVEKYGENNFIVLGDMNINQGKHLLSTLPRDFVSLNSQNLATNTNPNSSKPYDHVILIPELNPEIPLYDNFMVYDLAEMGRKHWNYNFAYPGDPYVHNAFRQVYSDHHPVKFKIYPGPKDLD